MRRDNAAERKWANNMSASVIPVIGRLTTSESAPVAPAAIPVTFPAAPVEHIRAEEANNAQPLGTACGIAEDSLIFPALVCPPLLSVEMRIFAPSQRQTKTLL